MHQHPYAPITIFKSAHALKVPLDGPENVATRDTENSTHITQYAYTLRDAGSGGDCSPHSGGSAGRGSVHTPQNAQTAALDGVEQAMTKDTYFAYPCVLVHILGANSIMVHVGHLLH